MINKNRADLGAYTATHRDLSLVNIVGDPGYDFFVENINNLFDYEVGFIPQRAAHRPDLISQVFYGTPAYWWLILLFNGIADPFEQLNTGDQILIPKL